MEIREQSFSKKKEKNVFLELKFATLAEKEGEKEKKRRKKYTIFNSLPSWENYYTKKYIVSLVTERGYVEYREYLFTEEEELKETPPRTSRGLTQFLPWTAYSIDPRWLPGNSTPWALDILAQVQRHQSLRGKVLSRWHGRPSLSLSRRERENFWTSTKKIEEERGTEHYSKKK